MGTLWETLPAGFLRKGYAAWSRLDWQIQKLIVDLATEQNFKCAFCPESRSLVIDHDHYPDEGPGDRLTIHNVRGLLCQRCNWHMGIYEADKAGSGRGWEHVLSSDISDGDYAGYIDAYSSRLEQLDEEKIRRTCSNYWWRRILLDKFDEWKDGWTEFPWQWGFEEIKEKRHGRVRTSRQFFNALFALVNFVAEEQRKDPNYLPPENVYRALLKTKRIFDRIRPFMEERLKALGYTVTDDGQLLKPGEQPAGLAPAIER